MQDVNFTDKEQQFLDDFNEWVNNDLTKSRIAAAAYLLGEISYQYGDDIAFIMSAHQRAMMDSLLMRDNDNPYLADKISSYANEGYGKVSSIVNHTLSDIVCSRDNDFGKDKGEELSKLTAELQEDCIKGQW
jgi:uncharacterized membrane protein